MSWVSTRWRHIVPCLGFITAARCAASSTARHILNIGQIMELLKERYGSIAKISLHYMEVRIGRTCFGLCGADCGSASGARALAQLSLL